MKSQGWQVWEGVVWVEILDRLPEGCELISATCWGQPF